MIIPVLETVDACEPEETLVDVSNPADSSLTTSRHSSMSAAVADDDNSASLHSTAQHSTVLVNQSINQCMSGLSLRRT